MSQFYLEYSDLDLNHLEDWEKEVVSKLKEVVKLCGKIYDKQVNSSAGFYPSNVTIDDIEDAAVDNPDILSPYTKVVREGASFKSIYYYEEFEDEINEIVGLLQEVSSLYEENNFEDYSEYLKVLASDLKSADFSKSEKLWLRLNGVTNVDIKLGPIETYQDKLLGIKKSFQANLRMRDEGEYKNLTDYIEVINAILPMSPFAKDISKSDFVVRVDKVIAMGGWHADLIPRSSNYPSDASKYDRGVKALIYTNNIARKQPVINRVVKNVIDSSYMDEEKIGEANVRLIIFHEISETISKLKYKDAYDKLRNYRDQVVEVYANLMGIKSGAVQVLKGFLTTEEYQYILISYVASALRGWYLGKSNSAISAYSDGYKLSLNYFIEKEAIKLYEDKIQVDYAKMYSAVDSLTTILSNIVMEGDVKAAEELFKSYSNEKELLKLENVISNLVTTQ